ncbi:hypothetical protein BM1_02951 [Bipolaris maydis]|uniref:uncharacterized protein n=1 Tax=Cochliobolus heterostrophus TaxID=5016 RepID=UPI0024DA7414|nr:hypothetical protein BM1_02951 [Bipolaris maydis]KAJ5020515.1 hypothetical protein J3E73DRAFT_376616 [Bipolaris maydis]KAJ5030668.1 hypothetical protein J3E73DRAFT_366007 [Bipolaris maydis]KAJ6274496.1 hypothetical protein PSV08DRAFT_347235 [Bipolaris maydis]KAJ6286223.1 hypothetical protein J3E71DRAFT_338373 [Bipolaris maydis]
MAVEKVDPTTESSHGAESALAIILFLLPLTSPAQRPLRVSTSSPLPVPGFPGYSTSPKMAAPQSHSLAGG